jgi:hypothetical protein
MLARTDPTECATFFDCGCCDRCVVEQAGPDLIIPAEPEAIVVELPDPRELIRDAAGLEVRT